MLQVPNRFNQGHLYAEAICERGREEKKGCNISATAPRPARSLPKHPNTAAGAVYHKEEPNCLSKVFSLREAEVNSKRAVRFWPLFNKSTEVLPIKWSWHMRIWGQYLYTFSPLAFHTKPPSKHIDLASQGRLYGTCFPITRIGLFLWHSLRENALDWPLVMTEKLGGGKFVGGRAASYQTPRVHCTQTGRFTVHRPPCACPVSSGWLKTLLTQQKHCQR